MADIPTNLLTAKHISLNENRKFWNIVFGELGSVNCNYTGSKLQMDDYAVEHFIPYAFVSHDLMWNLIPADRSFNCSKNEKLPSLDRYFEDFFRLQKSAIEIIQHCAPKNRFLED